MLSLNQIWVKNIYIDLLLLFVWLHVNIFNYVGYNRNKRFQFKTDFFLSKKHNDQKQPKCFGNFDIYTTLIKHLQKKQWKTAKTTKENPQ